MFSYPAGHEDTQGVCKYFILQSNSGAESTLVVKVHNLKLYSSLAWKASLVECKKFRI